MIRLRTLGECIIEVDGELITPEYDTLFAALVYLTTERGKRVDRQTLCELLWPHHHAAKARHCLRQLLYRLRLSGGTIEGDRETLLVPERLVAPTFSAGPASERLVAERDAGTLVIGAWLPGYDPHLSDRFTEWLEHARGQMQARVRRVLLEVARVHRLRGEWDHVDALACAVLSIDPLNEEATFAHAEATAMAGAKTEALSILDRFVEELGPQRERIQLPATMLRRRIAERFPSPRYGRSAESCFVGRAALMETVSTMLLRARNGEGSGVMLVGAPGIGKTRLVHEISKAATMQGVRVVRASLSEPDAERPLSAFTDAVPQLRALPGAIGVSPDALSFLDRLTEVYPGGRVTPDDVSDPRWIAARIRQAIVDLCDAVSAEATVLLAIEDVQWLDASSWAVVSALLEWLPTKRFLLLLTSRGPHPSPVTPVRCVERLTVLPVLPIKPDAAAKYVRAIAADHGGTLTEEALQWCVAVGDGNPLYLRELGVHCLEGGPTGVIPPSLHGLLDARVERLSPASRRVLDAIVLLGEFASLERLSSVLELPAYALAEALRELTLEKLFRDDGDVMVPRHSLIGTRVLHAMPQPVRRLLHRRVALVLSDMSGPDTSERLMAAAQHWQHGGMPARSVDTLLEAASAIQRIGAIRESIQLLNAALAFADSGQQRARVRRSFVPVLILSGELSKAAEVSALLVEDDRSQSDPQQCALDRVLYIGAHHRSGHAPVPLLADALLLAADRTLAPSIRVSAAAQGVVIAATFGLDVDHQLIRDLLQSRRPASPLERREYLRLSVVYNASFGSLHTAVNAARELYELASHDTDGFQRLAALMNVGLAFYQAALHEEARNVLEFARAEATRLQSTEFAVHCSIALASVCADLHDAESTQRWITLGAAAPDQKLNDWHQTLLLEAKTRLAIIERRFDVANELARALIVRAQTATFPLAWQRREALTLLLEVRLKSSDGPVAQDLLDEAISCHVAMQDMPQHDRTAAGLIVALQRAGRAGEARELERTYVAQHRRSLVEWISANHLLGLVYD